MTIGTGYVLYEVKHPLSFHFYLVGDDGGISIYRLLGITRDETCNDTYISASACLLATIMTMNDSSRHFTR